VNGNRLGDYLDHMRAAADDASGFVTGMTHTEFLQDRRTQQAVIMSLIIIGEAAAKIMASYPDFVTVNPQLPWRSIRGMRNRMTHGYFDIDLDVVWNTLQQALPDLLRLLKQIIP
jgi:uncharacterized protein with HEPN domain